ncbi:penicillin-binding protein 1A [Niallia circulans]|uniref:PBP1A family penicillin-binding protein n=1 Tax=Niallia circulans TaxID=1397 RepID=A0A941JSV3_NIACI|nr:penicillin-binding protein 1A [Niallia circulans]MCB5238698.1 PBP1A family penicillin-binding protein [Niallia circulans]
MTDKYQTREERRKQLETSKKNAPKKAKKKSGKNLFKRVLLILLTIGIIGIIAGGVTFAIMVKDAPELNPETLKDPISSTIYDKNNKEIAKVGAVNRDYVNYEDIPDLVKDAFIATEDSRFFKHHGIDPIRLGGAVIANFRNGFGSEGASTITQQVVKNFFFNQPQKTLNRKAQEAWLALELERKYSKEEIFEMYVNKIFMSENMSGVKTAAKVYFDKNLDELTLPEAALLAGMPQAPNAYNPFNNPERAEKRRNIVLSLMHQHGYISKAEMEEAQKTSVEDSLVAKEDRKTNDLPYDPFIKQVIAEIEKKYPDVNVFTDGLEIYTTMDKEAQEYVEELMYEGEIVPFPDEQFQAGITLLDTKTGGILALGGDRDPDVKLGTNYATDTKRQPGSTAKPILDYGPAVEHLKWGTYQTIVDERTTYSDGKSISNWDNSYKGSMTMRKALEMSRNIPALKAFQAVGAEKAKDFAVNLGIPLENAYESYAIGAFEASTLEMAGAYSAFGNEGVYNTPHAVRSFKLKDGTKINMEPKSKVVMQDYTAFLITDMLKGVLTSSDGTGNLANVPGLPVAGKTGTTNYSQEERTKWGITNSGSVPDAWFAGYTTNFTMAVWTGYTDRKNPLTPGPNQKIAQQIFKAVMGHISEDVETADFKKPDSVETVKIEKGTFPARLASSYTPSSQILTEYAVKGNILNEVSQKYNKPNAPTGVKATYNENSDEIDLSWDYGDKEGVKFDVSVSVDGGANEQLTVTSDTSLKIAKPTPGSTYTFTVKAIKNEQDSDPASGSISVPAKIEEQPPEDPNETIDDEDDQDDPNGEDSDDNQDDGDNEDSDNGEENNNNQSNNNGNNNDNGNNGGNNSGNNTGNNNGQNNTNSNDANQNQSRNREQNRNDSQ